jgi:septation ring formation regulator EzrA
MSYITKEHFDKTINKKVKIFDERVKSVDERFDAVDKRFDAVDKRFDAVDKRFDAVDKKFDAVDKKFDDMKLEMYDMRTEYIVKIDLLKESLLDRIDTMHRENLVLHENTINVIKTLKEGINTEQEVKELKQDYYYTKEDYDFRIGSLERKVYKTN